MLGLDVYNGSATQLEGFGSIMAANEIDSHCELLIESGDVTPMNGNAYAATGSMQFETDIRDLAAEQV